MKAQRFRIGQVVTLRKRPDGFFANDGHNTKIPGVKIPQFGEICKVNGYEKCLRGTGRWFITLVGYGYHAFLESCFEPLVSDSILEKELQQINEPATL